ncbi:MAG: hypothetical protein IJD81_07905 [Oscillospiraceae bacterium]|nr:hypothetical protein [Oscillospiraceae bacterium]
MKQTLFTKEIQEIIRCVEALQEEGKRPVVIGIDGMAASGKTTITALLEQALDAAVIHMDDFFLPQGFRTPERLRTPGGNVYHERFKQEVVPYLRCGDLFGYRIFDAHKHEYTGTRVIPPKSVIIVEGSYCMHPELGDIYDLKIFSKVGPDEQMHRIKTTRARVADLYKAMWIPMENRYHAAFDIEAKCDVVITSGAPQSAPPLEIERKFLIRMPDLTRLVQAADRVIDMEQVYLKGGAPGVSMRIRKSVEGGSTVYHRNEKQRITDMVRIEREEEIDDRHYKILLGFADPDLRVIKKTRYCLPAGELTAEVDIFPFWQDRAFCEVELPDETAPVTLPDFLEVIREVTEDKRYTNLALAREIPTEEI